MPKFYSGRRQKQYPIRGTGEITRVRGLLDTLSLLDLAGCVVTVDALNTQRDTEVKAHNAEYVMALKPNQAKLYEDVTWFDNADAKQNTFETHKRSRGRQGVALLHSLDQRVRTRLPRDA